MAKIDHQKLLKKITNNTPLNKILDFDSTKPLAGGVASIIFSVKIKSDQMQAAEKIFNQDLPSSQLAIKHTFKPEKISLNRIFGHTDQISLHERAHLTQDLDQKILKLFQDSKQVKVPTLLYYNQKKRLTVMVDFNSQDYTLMQNLIIDDNLPMSSAKDWGQLLGNLVKKLKEKSDDLEQIEDNLIQARERFEELYTFLRVDLNLYREIEQQYVDSEYLIDPDVHPKNIAVNEAGDCLLFDFGRSIKGDIQHVPATFSAHIALSAIGGCFADDDFAINYLKKFIKYYNETVDAEDKINTEWFIKYMTAELIHRGLSGRWLDPNLFKNSSIQETERAVHDFGIRVFRPEKSQSEISTIDDLLDLIKQASQSVKAGKYQFMR